jgi:YbbR domain-containing protein
MTPARFDFLRRNLGYKILSLVLALLLYAVVYAQRRPLLTKDVFVQPEVVNLPPDMLVKTPPPGATVTVSGSTAGIEEFRIQRVKAVVNLVGAKPGSNSVEIKYRTEETGVEVVGPQRTQVVVEKQERVTFSVDVLYNEKPPPGYVFEGPKVEPTKVGVRGLRSEVSRVARVVAIVNKSDSSGAFDGLLDVIAQSTRYEEVDGVEIEPSKVMVTLGLKKAPLNKDMVLSANLQGTPAPGVAVIGYTFDPLTVNVTGSKNDITDRSTISVPVDLSGLRESVTRRVRVPVPLGLSLVAPESGMVSLRIDVRVIAPPSPQPASPAPPENNPANSRENP